jgi:hypothetical protein
MSSVAVAAANAREVEVKRQPGIGTSTPGLVASITKRIIHLSHVMNGSPPNCFLVTRQQVIPSQ